MNISPEGGLELWLPMAESGVGEGTLEFQSDFSFFLCFSASFECSIMNMYYLSKQKIYKKPHV